MGYTISPSKTHFLRTICITQCLRKKKLERFTFFNWVLLCTDNNGKGQKYNVPSSYEHISYNSNKYCSGSPNQSCSGVSSRDVSVFFDVTRSIQVASMVVRIILCKYIILFNVTFISRPYYSTRI